MSNYFDDPAKQAQLKQIMDSWLGTPFRHHCGVKGLGTDCAHFVCRVFEEMGLLKWRKNLIPDYPRDWSSHDTRELLLERLAKEFNIAPADLDAPMNGDIIVGHYGRAAGHVMIYSDGHIYHAADRVGVVKIHYSDPVFRRHMKFSFRLLA